MIVGCNVFESFLCCSLHCLHHHMMAQIRQANVFAENKLVYVFCLFLCLHLISGCQCLCRTVTKRSHQQYYVATQVNIGWEDHNIILVSSPCTRLTLYP